MCLLFFLRFFFPFVSLFSSFYLFSLCLQYTSKYSLLFLFPFSFSPTDRSLPPFFLSLSLSLFLLHHLSLSLSLSLSLVTFVCLRSKSGFKRYKILKLPMVKVFCLNISCLMILIITNFFIAFFFVAFFLYFFPFFFHVLVCLHCLSRTFFYKPLFCWSYIPTVKKNCLIFFYVLY